MFLGDGCLMEGVASEAASLAGHLQLGNLIAVRDCMRLPPLPQSFIAHSRSTTTTVSLGDLAWQVAAGLIDLADISIDGDTAVAFTENVEQRFQSYGWHTLHVDDGDRRVFQPHAWHRSLM